MRVEGPFRSIRHDPRAGAGRSISLFVGSQTTLEPYRTARLAARPRVSGADDVN